jgi:hypothetical protein
MPDGRAVMTKLTVAFAILWPRLETDKHWKKDVQKQGLEDSVSYIVWLDGRPHILLANAETKLHFAMLYKRTSPWYEANITTSAVSMPSENLFFKYCLSFDIKHE